MIKALRDKTSQRFAVRLLGDLADPKAKPAINRLLGSGANTPEGRAEAARRLIKWLKIHPAEKVTLIAHGHGGNVAFKATEIASPGDIQISKLILLGTPIRNDYAPNLSVVDIIHNIYSADDIVQLLGTWTPDFENHARGDGRTLPEGPKIQNRKVRTKTDNPHSELHTAELWKRARLGDILKVLVA